MFGIEKKNKRYQIDEGLFDFLKIMAGGKLDLKNTPDSKLSKKGKALKKSVIAFQAEMEDEARKAGFKSLGDYVAHQKKKLGQR